MIYFVVFDYGFAFKKSDRLSKHYNSKTRGITMSTLILESSIRTDITSVSNIFIDEFMPKASGDFVKIYLHLLRMLCSDKKEVNLTGIADLFDYTERDVIRALKYWESLGLLDVSFASDNTITGIRLEPYGSDRHIIKGVHSMTINSSDSDRDEKTLPGKKRYTAKEIDGFTKDEQIGQLLFIAQTYLGKPLSSNDINCILYMYNSLGLSTEYLDYMIDTCVSEGMTSLSAIEKRVTELFAKGIKDIESAKSNGKNQSNIYKRIMDAFGLTDRLAGRDEKEFIMKWQNDFSFSEDIMIEACHKTISTIHKPSFDYANRILESWHKAGVNNLDDVKKIDEEFACKNTKKASDKKKAGVPSVRHKAGQNISNRNYDFKSLEKQLTK